MSTLTAKEKNDSLKILLAFVLLFPLAIFDCYVFTRIWAWFIAGPFGLPLINKAQAWGISLVVVYATKHLASKVFEDKKDFLKAIWQMATISLSTWGIGAIMHHILF